MLSESPSSTPSLTPDYTGSPDSPSGTAKKTRRHTAFYPNMNSSNKPVKPFSRSAAKRESVMALGSIEHLQHYFTKTGIAAKSIPLNKGHLVPAIGSLAAFRSKPSLGGIAEFQLPPSPIVPEISRPAFPPIVKTYETNPEVLLPGVIEDIISTAHAWSLDDHLAAGPSHDPQLLSAETKEGIPGNFDVLNVLKITTRAIRSVRNYVLSLPDESAGTLRAQFRSKIASGGPTPKRLVSQPKAQPDPLSMIRKSALEVLSVLRELEEASRVPLSDEAYDAQSDHGSQGQTSHSRVASPSFHSDYEVDLPNVDPDMSFSYVRVQGRDEPLPVYDEDGQPLNTGEEEIDRRDHWDERLVLGGGWLYKQDIRLENLGKEKCAVKKYVDMVDDVLFGGAKGGKKGWERERERIMRRDKESKSKGRRVSAGDAEGQSFRFPDPSERPSRRVVSTGMLDAIANMSLSEEPEEMETVSEEESVDEEDLPDWAKRGLFPDDAFGRTHALLRALLPEHLLSSLPSPEERHVFLQGISSGQLLCVAYNAGVRRSRRPWGYISVDSIHDIISLEQAADEDEDDKEKGKKGWTFRRTDNLRLWAAALKLRYLLPIIVPSTSDRPSELRPSQITPSSSPSKFRFPTTEPPITFDPRLVARREDGWEKMLEEAVIQWMNVVVDERRGDR